MRKLLLVAALSAGAIALTAGQASAFFGLFKHCCGKNCANFCVKPYNAFSPVCFGSLCFDGCGPCFTQSPGPPPGYQYPHDAHCHDGACYPDHLPPHHATVQPGGNTAAPGAGAPQFMPPAPTPVPNGAGAHLMPYWAPVQPVNYPYGYVPAVPMNYAPMNVPGYWYGQ